MPWSATLLLVQPALPEGMDPEDDFAREDALYAVSRARSRRNPPPPLFGLDPR